jgi:integrase
MLPKRLRDDDPAGDDTLVVAPLLGDLVLRLLVTRAVWSWRGIRRGLSGHPRCTFTPYIYSRAQIRALVRATRSGSATGVVDASIMRALILFLCGTGARLGEALTLRCENVDLDARRKHVRARGKERLSRCRSRAGLRHK